MKLTEFLKKKTITIAGIPYKLKAVMVRDDIARGGNLVGQIDRDNDTITYVVADKTPESQIQTIFHEVGHVIYWDYCLKEAREENFSDLLSQALFQFMLDNGFLEKTK